MVPLYNIGPGYGVQLQHVTYHIIISLRATLADPPSRPDPQINRRYAGLCRKNAQNRNAIRAPPAKKFGGTAILRVTALICRGLRVKPNPSPSACKPLAGRKFQPASSQISAAAANPPPCRRMPLQIPVTPPLPQLILTAAALPPSRICSLLWRPAARRINASIAAVGATSYRLRRCLSAASHKVCHCSRPSPLPAAMRRLASVLISPFIDVVEQMCPLLDGGFVVFG
jgi:hypothetical protein